MRVLLIYPENPDTFWSFKHVLRFVSKKSTFPPLGLLTVAAMLPPEWELKLVDLNVEQLRKPDLHWHWADYVMLSAMIVHKPSVRRIIAESAAAGVPIIAGGPLFTTDHALFPEIQHFVLGEAEEVMPKLVADMLQGTMQQMRRAMRQGITGKQIQPVVVPPFEELTDSVHRRPGLLGPH